MEINKIYNGDCTALMKELGDRSIAAVVTDPPYQYLKGMKLDRPFDESTFFDEVKRILKPEGFIILFGRGTPFYRWNTMLADRGFKFREEVIWNSRRNSMPALKLKRIHETVSIHTINGKINATRVPYVEYRAFNPQDVAADMKRIKSALNSKELHHVLKYLENGTVEYKQKKKSNFFNGVKGCCRTVNVCRSMIEGVHEKSIIEIQDDHYGIIHPTQKPVRLMERLLALAGGEGDLILDPFLGGGSTAIAAYNMRRSFIGFEIDAEYFGLAEKRIREHIARQRLF